MSACCASFFECRQFIWRIRRRLALSRIFTLGANVILTAFASPGGFANSMGYAFVLQTFSVVVLAFILLDVSCRKPLRTDVVELMRDVPRPKIFYWCYRVHQIWLTLAFLMIPIITIIGAPSTYNHVSFFLAISLIALIAGPLYGAFEMRLYLASKEEKANAAGHQLTVEQQRNLYVLTADGVRAWNPIMIVVATVLAGSSWKIVSLLPGCLRNEDPQGPSAPVPENVINFAEICGHTIGAVGGTLGGLVVINGMFIQYSLSEPSTKRTSLAPLIPCLMKGWCSFTRVIIWLGTWHAQIMITIISYCISIASIIFVLAVDLGEDDTSDTQCGVPIDLPEKLSYIALASAVTGLVLSILNIIQRTWHHLKFLPTDDNFRLSAILKIISIFAKAAILFTTLHTTVDVVLALAFAFSLVVTAFLTMAVDIFKVFRTMSILADIRFPWLFLISYCVNYIWAKLAAIYVLVSSYHIKGWLDDGANPRWDDKRGRWCHDITFPPTAHIALYIALPFVIYGNNESARFICGRWREWNQRQRDRKRRMKGLTRVLDVKTSKSGSLNKGEAFSALGNTTDDEKEPQSDQEFPETVTEMEQSTLFYAQSDDLTNESMTANLLEVNGTVSLGETFSASGIACIAPYVLFAEGISLVMCLITIGQCKWCDYARNRGKGAALLMFENATFRVTLAMIVVFFSTIFLVVSTSAIVPKDRLQSHSEYELDVNVVKKSVQLSNQSRTKYTAPVDAAAVGLSVSPL